jgi:hypothetical protein
LRIATTIHQLPARLGRGSSTMTWGILIASFAGHPEDRSGRPRPCRGDRGCESLCKWSVSTAVPRQIRALQLTDIHVSTLFNTPIKSPPKRPFFDILADESRPERRNNLPSALLHARTTNSGLRLCVPVPMPTMLSCPRPLSPIIASRAGRSAYLQYVAGHGVGVFRSRPGLASDDGWCAARARLRTGP